MLALLFYVRPSLRVDRTIIGLAVAFTLVGVGFVRFLFYQFLDESLFKRRVLVYGCGKNAAPISRLRRRSDRRGFTIVGFLQPEGEAREIAPDLVLT